MQPCQSTVQGSVDCDVKLNNDKYKVEIHTILNQSIASVYTCCIEAAAPILCVETEQEIALSPAGQGGGETFNPAAAAAAPTVSIWKGLVFSHSSIRYVVKYNTDGIHAALAQKKEAFISIHCAHVLLYTNLIF